MKQIFFTFMTLLSLLPFNVVAKDEIISSYNVGNTASTSNAELNGVTRVDSVTEKVDESGIFFEPYQQAYYLNGDNIGMLSDFYSTLLNTAPEAMDGVKGRAVVKFCISENGIIDPNSIKIISNKSVPEDYMDAAIEAIKNLGHFEPGKLNGTPRKVWYNLPIIYPVPLDKIKTS